MRRTCVRQGLAAAITIVIAGAADPARGAVVRDLPPVAGVSAAPTTRPAGELASPDVNLALQPLFPVTIPPLPGEAAGLHELLPPEPNPALLAGAGRGTAAGEISAASAASAPRSPFQAPRPAQVVAGDATAPAAGDASELTRHIGPAPEVVQVPAVPEPSTGVLLLAAGIAALGRRGCRTRRASPPAK